MAPSPGRPVSTQPRGAQTYRLDDVDMRLRGCMCFEYDLSFDGVPANLQSGVVAWPDAAVEADAAVCWFAFEGSLNFDHVLTAEVASQIFALGSRYGIELALDDQS